MRSVGFAIPPQSTAIKSKRSTLLLFYYYIQGVKMASSNIARIIDGTTNGVIESIAQKRNVPLSQSKSSFESSKTYKTLKDPETKMWKESVPFIVNEYFSESYSTKKLF